MTPRRKKILLIGIALAALCCCLLILWRLQPPAPSQPPTAEPAYVPPPMEEAAVPLADWAAPQGLPTLQTDTYAFSINPEPATGPDGLCGVWLANPEGNAVYLMLDVRLEEGNLLIYRSGLIGPGTGLGEITLPQEALSAMQPGENGVLLTVYSFAVEGYTSMGEAPLRTVLYYEKGA